MRFLQRLPVFLLFALLLPLGSVAGQNMTYASGSYTIRPLDVVRVTLYVADEQQFTTEVRVSSSGTVSLPYLDQVTLAGLTVEEARRFVYEPYNRDYYVEPHIDLVVLTSAARTVTVMGQVNAQGQVFLPSEQPLSLLQAIAAAGGFRSNDLADKRRVRITRIGNDGEEEVITVNADDISATDVPLQENDLIFVPRRMW